MMRTILFIFLISALGSLASASPKVLFVLNEGYRPEEYFQPRKIFEDAGFQIKVTGRNLGNILPSRKHIHEVPPVPVDMTFEKVMVDNFDAVIFVGGNGAWNDLLPNSEVHRILLESVNKNKVTGLICAATGLLATANNLDGDHPQFKGRHVTGYFEVEGILKKVGLVNFDKGIADKPYVVKDGKLITGRDPMSAQLFGQTIAKELMSKN